VTKQPKIKGGILFLSSNILNGGTGVLAHKFQQEPGLKSSRAPFRMYLSKGQLMNERSAASCVSLFALRLLVVGVLVSSTLLAYNFSFGGAV
jgi:hypothetical protein